MTKTVKETVEVEVTRDKHYIYISFGGHPALEIPNKGNEYHRIIASLYGDIDSAYENYVSNNEK